MELDVHLIQGFLHVLDVNRCHLNQSVAMAKNRTDIADRLFWPEGRAKQAHCVQVLKPLAILDVCLPPWYVLHMTGIDKKNLESPRFEQLEKRYPVHARRFHCYCLDLAVLQP